MQWDLGCSAVWAEGVEADGTAASGSGRACSAVQRSASRL